MSKFQLYRDAGGKFRFRLRAGNNQIVAVGEAYEQRASCINGIRSIQKNCKAEIEDLTVNGQKVPNPKYQIYKDVKGEFRFRLKAPNGKIIAEGEGYESKEGCLNGIEVVRGSCDSEIEDFSVTKKLTQDNIPDKNEEVKSPSQTEPPIIPVKAETEAVLTETKNEELPQQIPLLPLETKISQESLPAETILELYAIPQNVNKGNSVTLQGRLSSINSGRGISGAKIKIYERDRSILGDDYLSYGATGEDGVFTILWKARPLSWRKNNGNIYAKFAGNERAKPSKSDAQTINIR